MDVILLVILFCFRVHWVCYPIIYQRLPQPANENDLTQLFYLSPDEQIIDIDVIYFGILFCFSVQRVCYPITYQRLPPRINLSMKMHLPSYLTSLQMNKSMTLMWLILVSCFVSVYTECAFQSPIRDCLPGSTCQWRRPYPVVWPPSRWTNHWIV